MSFPNILFIISYENLFLQTTEPTFAMTHNDKSQLNEERTIKKKKTGRNQLQNNYGRKSQTVWGSVVSLRLGSDWYFTSPSISYRLLLSYSSNQEEGTKAEDTKGYFQIFYDCHYVS